MTGVSFLKAIYHCNSIVKIFFYKILYRNSFCCGKNVSFRKNFSLIINSKDAKVKIGDGVFFNNNCSISCLSCIVVGANSIFGENVKIYDHNHIYKDLLNLIKLQGFTCDPIGIGSNCWIGSNVVILKGVNIGDGCVIGSGCVIYKDIESGSVIVNYQDLREIK